MSFGMFLILVVLGILFLNSDSFLVKLIGVLLLFLSLNPLCISLTHRSIPQVISGIYHSGEKAYNGVQHIAKGTGDTLSKFMAEKK